ncbi:MAG: hypothetical protein II427_05075 [Firmicutes bacterium]|nr:hypothetical protein [Bacillota bacterium]
MKKLSAVLSIVLLFAVLLAACGTSTFTTTSLGEDTKIEVENADDGATSESLYVSIGKNRIATIESALDKGQLQIDITEAIVFKNEDDSEDVMLGDIYATVTVGPDDKEEIELPQGDYIYQLTAIGTTNGTVTIDVEKKQ